MKLPWHIVKKDLRRFWLAAVLLVGLTALKLILLNGVGSIEIGNEWNGRMFRFQILLLLAQWILSFIVAVAVVHEDPVSEAGALWEILPVTRWQLLVAKMTALGLLTLLPVLLTITVGWVALGLPVDLLCWPLLVAMQAQVGICLIGFTFGSLTRNMAHVIFWLIGVYVALVIPSIFPIKLGGEMGLPAEGPRMTSVFIFYGVFIVAGIAVTLNQYFSRSWSRSVALLLTGVLCSIVLTTLRPSWDLTPILFPRQRHLDQAISKLPVTVTEATIENFKVGSDATALVRVSVDDRSAPFLITQDAYFGKWTFSEGGPVYSQAKVYHPPFDHVTKRAIVRAFGFTDPSLPSSLDIGAETVVSSADAGRVRDQSLLYDGQMSLYVRSVAIEGEIDLAAGEKLESTSGSFLIKRVESGSPLIRVEIEARNSGMIADPGGFFGFNAEAVAMNNYNYALVSHDSHAVLVPSRTSSGIAAYAHGALLIHAKFEFVLPDGDRGKGGLAGWKLAQIRLGPNERAILHFRQHVRLNGVPAIVRDPSWLK